MSKQMRKLGYWSIDFSRGDRSFFDSALFCDFFTYLGTLCSKDLLQKDPSNNKAVSIDKIWTVQLQGHTGYEVCFKSCKYNHCPDYMSSTDGSERPTEKKLHEGDKEITHLCFRVNDIDAICVVEERRQGVSFGAIIRYLNTLLRRFLETTGKDGSIVLSASIISSEDFLTALDSSERISIAEIFVDKEVIGSGYLSSLNLDASAREEIVVTVKSKPRRTLIKDSFKNLFLAIATEGTQIRRIRLRGKDYDKTNIIIDSLNAKKKDEVSVELLESGVVNSSSIFIKMEEVLNEL